MTPCLPKCDETHAEDCPAAEAELKYWSKHFGQDHGTREERRARLMAMDPRNERAKAEGGSL